MRELVQNLLVQINSLSKVSKLFIANIHNKIDDNLQII